MAHFDATLLKTNIVSSEIKQIAEKLKLNSLSIYNDNDDAKIRDLLLILNCIDLTTLAGDDTYSNVSRLCYRAKNPLSNKIIEKLAQFDNHYHSNNITTGAVCVYPLRVSDCRQYLDRIDSNLPIASVVAGFPSGQSPIPVTLADITFAVQSGANEIDIVINRSLVLSGKWQELFNDIKIIAQHCHEKNVHLKVILSCGELGNLQNIYKASMCAMMAGADFIKTSTGKESINATLTYGLIMIRAITDFYIARNIRVGLKPAGGIKNATEALCWINLVRFYLGPEWLNNKLFRIGASSLLNNIEFEIFKLLFNRNPTVSELTI